MMYDIFSLLPDYWQIWLLIAVVLFILELLTPTFLIACFGVGALAASLSSLLGIGFWFDLLIFAVFSFLALYYLRPFVLKISKKPDYKTGMDALIGKEVRVVESIDKDSGSGLIISDGDTWRAISEDGEHIEKGTFVKIVSYDSLVVTVKKI